MTDAMLTVDKPFPVSQGLGAMFRLPLALWLFARSVDKARVGGTLSMC